MSKAYVNAIALVVEGYILSLCECMQHLEGLEKDMSFITPTDPKSLSEST